MLVQNMRPLTHNFYKTLCTATMELSRKPVGTRWVWDVGDYTVRGQSNVWRLPKYWPHPLTARQSVFPPAVGAGEGNTHWVERGVGVQYFGRCQTQLCNLHTYVSTIYEPLWLHPEPPYRNALVFALVATIGSQYHFFTGAKLALNQNGILMKKAVPRVRWREDQVRPDCSFAPTQMALCLRLACYDF
jgi:hypothetical protein